MVPVLKENLKKKMVIRFFCFNELLEKADLRFSSNFQCTGCECGERISSVNLVFSSLKCCLLKSLCICIYA